MFDTSAPGFAAECERQCLLVAALDQGDSDSSAAWLEENNRQLADDLDRIDNKTTGNAAAEQS